MRDHTLASCQFNGHVSQSAALAPLTDKSQLRSRHHFGGPAGLACEMNLSGGIIIIVLHLLGHAQAVDKYCTFVHGYPDSTKQATNTELS